MAKKVIEWNKIKADYFRGGTPQELAVKYGIPVNKIYNKVDNDKWAKAKTEITANVRNDVQTKIKDLTDLALDTLRTVINDPKADYKDKVSASRAILDVSGLKSLKQEVSGIDGVSVIVNRQAVQVESNN